MKQLDQRIALAEADGFKGCVDAECIYRNCQHLHRGNQAYFPEPYGVPRYPDYLKDLNAIYALWLKLSFGQRHEFANQLNNIVARDFNLASGKCFKDYTFIRQLSMLAHATAAQRCEALLRTFDKWKD